jgi:hypothetical protein
MSKLRRLRPSPALVISLIALFVAMGGIGYAAATIGTSDIKNNAVTTKKLHNNAVATKKIRNNAVTGAKVKESSLGQVPSAANSDALGGDPASAFQSRVQWALVNATGTSILAQSGGITITGHATGQTGLRFPGTDYPTLIRRLGRGASHR